MDEQQLYGETQSPLSITLLLWKSRADAGHLATRGGRYFGAGSPGMTRIGVHAEVGP
jgi:hypothetical protein